MIIKKIIFLLSILLVFVSCTKEHDKIKNDNINNKEIIDSTKTRVVLLGTGTPNPTPERSGPAVAVIVNGQAYLVDAGPGIVRRISASYNNGIKALKIDKVRTLFLTHLHSDHTTGLPDLLLNSWVLGRDKPFFVYGPKGTKNLTSKILEAYKDDIDNRLDGLEPIDKEGYKIEALEFDEGLVYRDSNVIVYAYRVEHGTWKSAYALKFVTHDRVITISGDCKPCEGILAASKGCDLLIHEVYSYKGFLTKKPEWQKYHKLSHTSTYELAVLANKVKPKKLVLYHVLSWGSTPENLLQEIKNSYNGNVECGSDLGVY